MPFELVPALVLPVLLVLAAWGMARRRRGRPRSDGPFIHVPDAPPGAEPVDAPGVSAPYSSFDPWAPPKQPVDWSPNDRPRH